MLSAIPRNPCARAFNLLSLSRCLSYTHSKLQKPLPPRIKFDDADLSLSYLKGSGPGGQKINKTNSAVQLTHNPSGIVVKCQATRSQSQNTKIARQLLADKVEQVERGDQSRVAIKTDRARRKKASKMKKSRRKYRGLEEGDKEEPDEQGVEEENASRDEKHDQGV